MAEAPAPVWRTRSRTLALDPPVVVGVVNVTPDSFSDGGLHSDRRSAIDHGRRLAAAGAGILDVGGESTRPGAAPVDLQTELARVVPVVAALAADGLVVSVDTSKAGVAAAALAVGAEIINDVTALADPEMVEVVAGEGAGVVLMHMQGVPATMQDEPHYDDVGDEVRHFLLERATALEATGVRRESIVIDPGIGFGKTVDHNLELLRRVGELVATGYPVMVGASRKGFLARVAGVEDPAERDLTSAAVTALVVAAGVPLVRVHDVAGSLQAARVVRAIAIGEY